MPIKKPHLLIVGGAGFIGSYVNKLLNKLGYTTVVLDNLSRGDKRAVTRGTFVEGDISNSNTLETLFSSQSFDAVLHFAAYIDVNESIRDPSSYYGNNVSNTLKLLDAALKYDVKAFIFSSTAAIFGAPQSDLIDEKHPKAPLSPYGRSKLIVEGFLEDYDHAYGLKSCSLRYFNAAGGDPDGEIANFFTYQSNLIPKIINSLSCGDGSVTIFGTDYCTKDGTCIRDYVHIHDLATAHILALDELLESRESRRYNLGNGAGFSVKEIIAATEKALGRSLHIIEGGRRAGDAARLVADATLAHKKLGWRPLYPDPAVMIADAWKALPACRR